MDQAAISDQLNDGLCPDQFKVCVPKSSTLLGKSWPDEKRWRNHVRHLKHAYELGGAVEVDECTTCDGKPGWELKGDYAVAHARDVHERIHRQVLGLDQVSAIDVGFAVWERQNRFGDFLSIRVHVNQKQPPERLAQLGVASFTQPSFLVNVRGDVVASGSRDGGRAVFGIAPDSTVRSFGMGLTLGVKSQRPGFDLPLVPPTEGGLAAITVPLPDVASDGGDQEEGSDGCLPCPEEDHDLDPVADRVAHLERLFARDFHRRPELWQSLSRFPISGVRENDFSIFCPLPIEETRQVDEVRLCISGVPIDVINAQYRPAITHPGGDARRGVFVNEAKRSDELENDEQLLIGRGRVSPLVGGISIGSVTDQAGTLGSIVWDRTDGTPCILGNWHVLAGSPGARVGQPIYQPAIFDGGSEDDVVAKLKRWHLGNRGDAALAELTHDRTYASGNILGLWAPISGTISPTLNMEVRKWGRTTGFSEGFVDGIALATNIDYGNGAIRFFRDQFHIAPLRPGQDVSQTGDSGSVVITSFEPKQQQDDLATMQRWLKRCCDSHAAFTLFKEIPSTLDEYREHCRTIGCGCEPLCDLLESLNANLCDLSACVNSHGGGVNTGDGCPRCGGAGICTVLGDLGAKDPYIPDHRRLLCYLEFARDAQRSISALIRDELTSVTFLEARLNRMYERFCLDHEGTKDAYCLFEAAFQEVKKDGALPLNCEEVTKLECLEVVETRESLLLCTWIETTLRVLRGVRGRLESCVNVSSGLRENLRVWHARCERVPDAEETFKRLCLALHFCCEQKDRCPSPRSFVKCLKQASQPPDDFDCGDQQIGRGASDARRGGDGPKLRLRRMLTRKIRDHGLEPEEGRFSLLKLLDSVLPDNEDSVRLLIDRAEKWIDEETDRRERQITRAYYAVGMIFAGDTPGSPFGEFAVASDISILEDELRFSLFPVFEPRSSFRELRERPGAQGMRQDQKRALDRAIRTLVGLQPGEAGGDDRGGGPQPDPERLQSGSGSGTGSGPGG